MFELNDMVQLSDRAGINAHERWGKRPGKVASIYRWGSSIEIGVVFGIGIFSDEQQDADAWFHPRELQHRTGV